MYYLREISLPHLGAYGLLSLLWLIGGWWLVSGAFHLRPRERVLAGAATGLVLFIVLGNLLAHVIPLTTAFWVSALAILVAGVIALRFAPREVRPTLRGQPWALLGFCLVLTAVFDGAFRGLALFDEYLHLPLISVMAAGDIPPHFYLNPTLSFAYHYGLQVWAASMVRLAGLTPWSAFDAARAFALTLTFGLGWLFFRRRIRDGSAVVAGAGALLLAGGARWLLLLLPPSVIAHASRHVILINTGANTAPTLAEALGRPWTLEGGGAVAFPFAFHSGVFVPLVFNLGSTGAMPYFTILLLLLLAHPGLRSWRGAVIVALVFASLALSAEHLFALLWVSLAVVILGAMTFRRRAGKPPAASSGKWAGVLALSGALATFQGGYLTEAAREVLGTLRAAHIEGITNYHTFDFRWPPALPSAHLAELSIVDGWQALVLLAELGPVLLLAPAATVFAWRQARAGRWLTAALGGSAVLSFLAPWFVRYGVDRSMTRLPATALWIWLLLALPLVLWRTGPRRGTSSVFARALLGVACLGGLVIGSIELTAIPAPQFTYFVSGLDAAMSARYWDRLPKDAQVLDRVPYRSVTLFGRPSTAAADVYDLLPSWKAAVATPGSDRVAAAGFDFVYFDETWWADLEPSVRATFKLPCVILVDEIVFREVLFRRLFDVRACGAGARAPADLDRASGGSGQARPTPDIAERD